MSTSIILVDRSDGLLPQYFTLNSVHAVGAPNGAWVTTRSAALQFAREVDAREFISTYHLAHIHNIELERVPNGD